MMFTAARENKRAVEMAKKRKWSNGSNHNVHEMGIGIWVYSIRCNHVVGRNKTLCATLEMDLSAEKIDL